jgi:hypothetical protein
VDAAAHQVANDPAQTKLSLKGKLMKLGDSSIFKLHRYDGKTLKNSSQMRVESIEEMDKIAPRIVRTTLQGKAPQDSDQVDEVSEAETKPAMKTREVQTRWCVTFGPSFVSRVGANGALIGVSGAHYWNTSPFFAVKAFFDVNNAPGENRAHFSSIGIGSNYYIFNRENSPFVGLDFGYGGSDREKGGAAEQLTGFVPGASAGYTFFRTSQVGVEVGLRFAALLRSGELGSPLLLGARIGLLF